MSVYQTTAPRAPRRTPLLPPLADWSGLAACACFAVTYLMRRVRENGARR